MPARRLSMGWPSEKWLSELKAGGKMTLFNSGSAPCTLLERASRRWARRLKSGRWPRGAGLGGATCGFHLNRAQCAWTSDASFTSGYMMLGRSC